MRKLVTNYAFDASERKITFLDYTAIQLERVLLVTNLTRNVIIYNFADPEKGGRVEGNTLILNYDTSTMDDSDVLQIFYEEDYDFVKESGAISEIKREAIPYKKLIEYDEKGNPIYIGEAPQGAQTYEHKWRIRKFEYDDNGNLIAVLWAEGSSDFDKVWENRKDYEYM